VKKRRITFVLIILFLAGLSCNLPESQSETATSPPPTLPSPTAEAVYPTETETTEPEIIPTITEEPLVIPESISGSPVGFTTTDGNGMTVTFYDLTGNPVGTINTPGMMTGPSNYMHISGAYTGNPQEVPIVFITPGNQGGVQQILNGETTTVVPMADVQHLRGVPGQDAYVYATVVWNGEALVSRFYPQSAHGGAGTWFWERIDPESWAIVPLSVEGENHELKKVFYTLEPWGIGGDIVYPPRKGLYEMDLDTRENVVHLTEVYKPIGVSPNNEVIAYTESNNRIPAGEHPTITIYNLVTGLMVPIDLAPESNRGGGYAVFSPDNQYVAWMEASGWSMAETPNFRSRVRIADTEGTVLSDKPDIDFAYVTGDPSARWTIPVGWLDGEYLLVEVRGDNWNEPALVKMRFDGTDMSLVASGQFLSFLYP